MTDLFTPLKVGPYAIPNRIILAPMTRCRAGAGNAPHALNAEYYAQRAGGGLLITEATQVSPRGVGYPGTPGIYSPEQEAGWKLVTDAVHRAGGRVFAQLWHVGRISHPALQPGGETPVSSSAVACEGETHLPDGSTAPYPTPRALTIDEIRGVIAEFRHGAEVALRAGFDGVELHGANGYLPDQFLRDGVNRRTDAYGGPVENRARFMLEIVRELNEVWGPSRVGVRLSPSGAFNGMHDSAPRATFGYAVSELGKLGLAFLHITEAQESDRKHGPARSPAYEALPASHFRGLFKGVLITNGAFSYEKAAAYIREGHADAIAFGELYLANPDLPERFRLLAAGRRDVPFNPPDYSTFYGGGARGYTDYPFMGIH